MYFNSSFSSTKFPFLILSTTLAGTDGRPDNRISREDLHGGLDAVGPRGPRAGSESGGMS